MSDPKFPLGVALMDDDHAHLEELMASVPGLADSALPAFLDTLRNEIAAHFVREEALMREANVPVLDCHVAQHARLVSDIDDTRTRLATMAAPALRAYLGRDVPNMVMAHIASVDQISARFLLGELDGAMVSRLRLPVEAEA